MIRFLLLLATLLFSSVHGEHPCFRDHCQTPRFLGRVDGRYIVDTDTVLTVDGERVHGLKSIPAGSTVSELTVNGEHVDRLAFTSPGK